MFLGKNKPRTNRTKKKKVKQALSKRLQFVIQKKESNGWAKKKGRLVYFHNPYSKMGFIYKSVLFLLFGSGS